MSPARGGTVEEAIENLREAVQLYLDDADVVLPDGETIVTTFEVT